MLCERRDLALVVDAVNCEAEDSKEISPKASEVRQLHGVIGVRRRPTPPNLDLDALS